MKKSQKLIVMVEGVVIETTFGALVQLIPLAEKLEKETAEWQSEGLISPPCSTIVIDGLCVSMMWFGLPPIVKLK